MAKIDFRNKINWRRRFRSPPRVETERDILRIFESDRGRIVNSPAIRRLQQKLRSSAGAQRSGAYPSDPLAGGAAGGALYRQRGTEPAERAEAAGRVWLEELTGPFESVVEMACLMHDIGNPPFGHFGEAAINDWFRQRLAPGDALGQPLTDNRCEVQALRLQEGNVA